MKSLTANNFVSDCARDLISVSFDQKLRSIHKQVTKKTIQKLTRALSVEIYLFQTHCILWGCPKGIFFGKKTNWQKKLGRNENFFLANFILTLPLKLFSWEEFSYFQNLYPICIKIPWESQKTKWLQGGGSEDATYWSNWYIFGRRL